MLDTSNVPETGSAIETIRRGLDLSLLTSGRIVVIGLGGIGSLLAYYLVLFLASLEEEFRVLLCDGDAYQPSNSYRVFVPDFINKALAQVRYLSQLFGRPGLYLRAFPHHLTEANCQEVIQEGDLVALAVDNHATRRIASRRVAELRNGVLISGGNDGVGPGERGTYGNIQVYGRVDGRDAFGSPLERFHPEIAHPADKNPAELDCIELTASGAPQILFVNLACASAMCAAIWRLIMPPDTEQMYDEVCFDILEAVNAPRWLSSPRYPRSAKAPRCTENQPASTNP